MSTKSWRRRAPLTEPRAAPSAARRALAVLETADPAGKCAAARAAFAGLQLDGGFVDATGWVDPPARPSRPERPELRPPGEVPRRRLGSPAGRFALLHAIAHIELNAIDLAFDMALRFAGEIARLDLDAGAFVRDWFEVGAEEARHFAMLADRLHDLGGAYGDLPAHDGLWRAAARTADDVLARLAIAPLVLEARGLDVTPGMIARLEAAGDKESAGVLGVIFREEIDHVAKGAAWFERVAAARGQEPVAAFRRLVASRFDGELKPPFNDEARAAAGLPGVYYRPPRAP